MIEYNPHDWRSHLLDIRGSLVREIFGRVSACVVWSAAVVATMRWLDYASNGKIDHDLEILAIPITAHTLLGAALSFLLILRTNSSYDRFWEGRKLWGAIVNETRNLARLACVHLQSDVALRNNVVQWTIAFAYSCMHRLRHTTGLDEMQSRLGEDALAASAAEHVPLEISRRISALLRQAREQGLIGDYVMMQIDQNVQLLIDYVGGCERIHRTPLPFAYMVHLRRAIIVYTFTLPFALYKDFGWLAIVVTFLVAYLFYGIEEIGVTIEDPFEKEDNDLPLEQMCVTIDRNLSALIEETPPLTPPAKFQLGDGPGKLVL
jgi:ion channel-forming bestrophin family protein